MSSLVDAQGSVLTSRAARAEVRFAVMLIVLTHACDVLSTYLRTPDLALERSPLYLQLGEWGLSGWPVLGAIKLFGVVLSVWMYAYYVRTRSDFYPSEPGQSFHDFLHYAHGVNAVRRADGSWVTPSPQLLMMWMAFTVSIGSAAYAYFLAVHNMLNTEFMAWMANGAAPAATFIVVALVFWHTLYTSYRHAAGPG